MTPYEVTIDSLLKQEQDYLFDSFSHQTALEIGRQLADRALRESLPIAIDITRHHQQLFFYAHQGTSIDNQRWIERKRNVTERFSHSSLLMKLKLKSSKPGSFHANNIYLSEDYALSGGCFPIMIKDTGMIGTITVSGLADIDDHHLIITVLNHMKLNTLSLETRR